MEDSVENIDLEVNGFSLIDISCEDDFLINNFPARDPQHLQSSGNRRVEFLEVVDANNVDNSVAYHEEPSGEQVPQSQSPEMTRKSGKYNLRKSLAWDSAFFTSAGFLEPEELSSMIRGTEKGEKQALPGIQEEMHRSTESLSTIESDSLTLENLEGDLFEDIRASIQKSSKVKNTTNLSSKGGSGGTEASDLPASKKGSLPSQDKKITVAAKKQNMGMHGVGKTTKQAGEFCKPPKMVGRVTPISIVSTKRASLSTNNLETDKDKAKASTAAVRGAPTLRQPASGGLRNGVPKPRPPLKSRANSSAASRTVLKTLRSSIDSAGSTSSDSSGKSSLKSVKRKNDPGTRNSSTHDRTTESPSRIASKKKNQLGTSRLSSYLTSVNQLSSSISPASSISEWSSESSSSHAANQRSNISRTSLDTRSGKQASAGGDTLPGSNAQNCLNDQGSDGLDSQSSGSMDDCLKKASRGTGGLVQPASTKPTGLRMPSPKMGFFDGMKSAARTPSGSMRSHSGSPTGFPKTEAESVNSSSAKIGKIQPGRVKSEVVRTKPDARQTSLSIKHGSRSPLQECFKVPTAKRNVRGSPLLSPKIQAKISPRTSKDSKLTTEVGGSKGCDMVIDDVYLEKDGSLDVLNNALQADCKGVTFVSNIQITATNGGADVAGCRSSICDTEKVNPPHKGDEGNDSEKAHLEDQVFGLSNQVGALNINMDNHEELTSHSISPDRVNISSKDNTIQEFSKLPTTSESEDSKLITEVGGSKGCDIAIKVVPLETDSSLDALNIALQMDSKDVNHVNNIHNSPINEGADISGGPSSICDTEKVPSPHNADEGAICCQSCAKNDSEKACLEDQVDGLCKLVGALRISVDNHEELITDSLSPDQVYLSSMDNSMQELSKSPRTTEIMANVRTPLAAKDSLCNQNGSFDASSGLIVADVETTAKDAVTF
ncbi:hypothetical protein HS088_TW03G00694 [Tripterygium wilfordii]|uniref:Uncharacterized protein n=1 Tax=Tripterygium wilfordii TaxID=458696 RepID=A0A7J7DVH0_TRIWF|nr:uncharacterized protein LOC119995494 isoform X2 [Tripterygium wilfordii]KAF5750358.1 hypothetical protein HS088_TW03G00694 [Tripterygium wilfordii]